MVSTKCGFNNGPAGSGRDLLVFKGPTVLVDIGFDPNVDPKAPNVVPVPGITGVEALVDTGATECCIDNFLAAHLKLPVVDKRAISGSSGIHTVNVYLAQVHVSALGMTMFGAFAGVDLVAGGQTHYALMGRTFLQHFTMTYEGRTGTVVLSND